MREAESEILLSSFLRRPFQCSTIPDASGWGRVWKSIKYLNYQPIVTWLLQ